MPFIDAANIACGGHAGDPVIMRRTIALAKKHGVKVGARECSDCSSATRHAHLLDPGYPDKAGFGRRALAMSYEQAYAEM